MYFKVKMIFFYNLLVHNIVRLGRYISPRWGTLIFSYMRRLESFFWFKILNFNIFNFFLKNEEYFRYEDFVDFLLGSSQNWTIFRGHFYVF